MAFAHKTYVDKGSGPRTHATKKKRIYCNAGLFGLQNEIIYDNGSTESVINNPNLFRDEVESDRFRLHGITGSVDSSKAGYGHLYLKGLNESGDPTVLQLLSKAAHGPPDTIFVSSAPINLISGNIIKKMGFDFINKAGSIPYLFHSRLKVKVILHESRGLLLLPIDQDLQKGPQCIRDTIFEKQK